jgi:hypothetical protein
MLGPVDIEGPLLGIFTGSRLPFLAEGFVLLALESVEQNLVKGFVKILLDTHDYFFEDIQVSRARTLGLLFHDEIFQDLVD